MLTFVNLRFKLYSSYRIYDLIMTYSFCTSFYISWLLFACIWFLVALAHGDLASDKAADHVDCVDNVATFTGSFLFSIETMTTIGSVGLKCLTISNHNQCKIILHNIRRKNIVKAMC